MTLVLPSSLDESCPDQRRRLEQDARRGHQAVYVGDDTVLCRVLGELLMYVDAQDRGHAPHLIMNGCWEPWITVALRDLLRPGMTCIDVGANLGYYTAVMAQAVGPTGAVVAFEPNPRLRELARASMLLNGFTARTVIAGQAACDRDGARVRFRVPERMPMNGRLLREGEQSTGRGEFEVSTVTLDTACRTLRRLDLVKIDVEGAEEQVWDGMQGLLDRHPGATVVLEFHGARDGAERLLGKIERRCRLRWIDYDGRPAPITAAELLGARRDEDVMLLLRRD
ncbi:MAG: FkbM family methyltransferase [Planctomycetota bacterium]